MFELAGEISLHEITQHDELKATDCMPCCLASHGNSLLPAARCLTSLALLGAVALHCAIRCFTPMWRKALEDDVWVGGFSRLAFFQCLFTMIDILTVHLAKCVDGCIAA